MNPLSILLLAAAGSPNTDSLVKTWTSLGHRVRIVSFHGSSGATVPVYHLPARIGRAGYALQARRIREIINAFKPDVLVGYHITSYGVAAATTAFHPMVSVAAGGDILPEQYGSLFRSAVMPAVARWVLGRCDFVFSWASHMTVRLVELGADPRLILTLPRGVDVDLFRPADRSPDHGSPIRLISTRSLNKVYQIDRLIEAACALEAEGAALHIMVVGDGPERGALENQRDVANLACRIEFTGAVPKPLVAQHLRASDIYVSLSRSDGVSASLLEAMATGIVPIVSNIPANRDWITHGENGLLVNAADVSDVANAIRGAATDQELRRRCRMGNPRVIASRACAPLNGLLMVEQLARLAEESRSAPGVTPLRKGA